MTLWFLGRRSHSFNTGHVDQILQVPPAVQHLVSGGPLAHFVRDRVRGSLDRNHRGDRYGGPWVSAV